jgi:uncharacterized protein YjbJ (UPF0337 family)
VGAVGDCSTADGTATEVVDNTAHGWGALIPEQPETPAEKIAGNHCRPNRIDCHEGVDGPRLFRPRLLRLTEDFPMDKDRIAGAAKEAKGSIKEAAGKVMGDSKLQAEGKADKAAGKVQNAVGGLKDAARDALNK